MQTLFGSSETTKFTSSPQDIEDNLADTSINARIMYFDE